MIKTYNIQQKCSIGVIFDDREHGDIQIKPGDCIVQEDDLSPVVHTSQQFTSNQSPDWMENALAKGLIEEGFHPEAQNMLDYITAILVNNACYESLRLVHSHLKPNEPNPYKGMRGSE